MPPDSSVEEQMNKKEKLQKWLDQNQYTRRGILRYEYIFGKTYVSVGGETTTRNFSEMLGLQKEMKVLDIGCGIGGSAFYMARRYGCNVHGVDLSTNMVDIAADYRNDMEAEVKHRVQFYIEDAVSMKYPTDFYDLVYSRDTILHIPDKAGLFQRFYSTIKTGGKVFITDYCCGEKTPSVAFQRYVEQRDYKLHTVADYGKILESVGFKNVEARDVTDLMMEMLRMELQSFQQMKEKFVEEFSATDFDAIEQGWLDKITRCTDGDQRWGLFVGTK